MYKAVIFDLDGTLLDTISDIADSVNAALRSNGYNEFTEYEYKYFVGKGIDELIRTIIKEGGIGDEEFTKLKNGYIEEYAKRHSAKTKPYEGILELLAELKANGIKTCILSNKPHFQTEEVVDKYFSQSEFDIVFGKLPEYEIKPNPESAEKIIELLGMRKEDILYVGDTNTDIQTAINAGLDSVGVLWGFRTEGELVEAGADYIARDPEDIFKLIKGD